ncbi:hypothetical protein Tco_1488281, partial [Tanacetum coccineum]
EYDISTSTGYGVSSSLSNTSYSIQLINMAWIDKDVIDHIAKVLEIVDLIRAPGTDSHQLRMQIFPLSLTDEARQWWIDEGEGKIMVWEELIEKFFCKSYTDSYEGEDEMLDEGDNWGIDQLEF